jgi:serine/threonine protein kinase/Flp pilus assembly protein TadD
MSPRPTTTNVDLEEMIGELAEQYYQHLRSGERPDIEEFTRLCPEAADALRQILPALEIMGAAPNPDRSDCQIKQYQTLGDFHIIRELGRGGMGVVYEAEQLSLGRRVALKVLPFAAMLDKQQLARFKNEARAAATLDHPNIVAVHFVGVERGVHFYAMQLIEGRSLAEIIAHMKPGRAPSAEDVTAPLSKPSTAADTAKAALPTERASGSPAFSSLPPFQSREYLKSVAKLGIQAAEALDHAHQNGILHRDVKPANILVDEDGGLWITDFGLARIEQDAGMTMTGDLLGTLRYMSPEQALAKRVVVDHRSDIYSLGVTLYELVTLQPAFTGDDRQELLRQIAFDEPRKPRQLNNRIPADLETIVLKATEKNPPDRYATAGELADDLRRFVEDLPINARRTSIIAVARKWCRRHPAEVRAASIVLLTIMVAAAGSLGWVARDRAARRASANAEAGIALEEANRLMTQAAWPSALESVRRAELVLSSTASASQLQHQVGSMRRDIQMALRLEQIRLDKASSSRADGGFSFASANRQYERAFREYGIDIDVMAEDKAVDHVRQSAIASELCLALNSWTRVMQYREASDPERKKKLNAIAQAAEQDPFRIKLGDASVGSSDEEVRAHLVELLTSQNGHVLPASAVVYFAENLRMVGGGDEAEKLLKSAVSRYPADFWVNFELAQSYGDGNTPDWDKAIRYYTAAIALRPTAAVAHNNLGVCFLNKESWQEAIECLQESLRLQPELGKAHSNLGLALSKVNRIDDAINHYDKAMQLLPDSAAPCINLGLLSQRAGAIDKAIECFQEGIEREPEEYRSYLMLGNVLRESGDNAQAIGYYRTAAQLAPNVGMIHNNLAVSLARTGATSEAIDSFRKALQFNPKEIVVHCGLAAALNDLGNSDEAIASYKEAIKLNPGIAPAHSGLGDSYAAMGQPAEAAHHFEEAMRLDPRFSDGIAKYALFLAGPESDSFRDAARALILGKQAVELNPSGTTELVALGAAHYRDRNWRAANDCLTKAIELGASRPNTLFYAAMAQWQVNDKQAARETYKRAVERIDTGEPKPVHSQRLRAEAEKLLGIEATTRTTSSNENETVDGDDSTKSGNPASQVETK